MLSTEEHTWLWPRVTPSLNTQHIWILSQYWDAWEIFLRETFHKCFAEVKQLLSFLLQSCFMCLAFSMSSHTAFSCHSQHMGSCQNLHTNYTRMHGWSHCKRFVKAKTAQALWSLHLPCYTNSCPRIGPLLFQRLPCPKDILPHHKEGSRFS